MRVIDAQELDLSLDELMFFESTALSLEWHALFCIWFAGVVSPAAEC